MPREGLPQVQHILLKSAAIIVSGVFTLSFVSYAVINSTTLIKKRKGLPCKACKGKGYYPCKMCRGKATIEWSPLYDPIVVNPCLCPTCDGFKVQRCLNCLGVGCA